MTIKDAGAEPGGMMRYGVPKYRLPRDVLDAEISRILDMGVTLETTPDSYEIDYDYCKGCGAIAMVPEET